MLLVIRICHQQSPPAFIRHYEGGVIGITHDPKQATRYDSTTRAQQIINKITSTGLVEVVDQDSVRR